MNPQWSNQRSYQQQQQPQPHLTPQQTGWQAPMMTGVQQPQARLMGYGAPQMQQPMQTGYGGYGGAGLASRAPPLASMQPQPTGYPAQPMMPQATGFPGMSTGGGPAMGGQSMLGSFSAVPSTFVSTFMPSNPNAQWNSGPGQYPQAQSAPAPLPEYFQQHNQQAMGQNAVQVQWELTADERKNYDKIFRAWDQGSGFITGQRALEVFKESGLERDDLMKVWALADRENRGKLNLAEFHVAMALIYRKLSGNPIPDVLPQALIPPSSRDLDQSVDFLKDLLRNDNHGRSTNLDATQHIEGAAGAGVSKYAKVRSFAAGASPEPGASQRDATGYKHNDSEIRAYKPSSRHLDRRNVRFQGEDEDSELASMKRDLQSTADMLDSSRNQEDDDEDLKGEVEDLKYRIRRVKDDIEYNRSGRRTEAKDQEQRRLERELLFLQHEKLPELEQRMRERDRSKRSSDRDAARKRDARNKESQHGGKHSGHDLSGTEQEDNEEDHKGYMQGSFGKQNERRTRFADTNEDSPKTKPTPASPQARRDDDRSARLSSPSGKTLTPSANEATSSAIPSPAPSPAPSTISKAQTPEERQAFIRAEAQRRVQERMRLLTGQSPSASPAPQQPSTTIDNTVTERMEQERKAAAERSLAEDKAAAEREKVRQMRLEEERLSAIKTEQRKLQGDGRAIKQISNEVTASEIRSASGDSQDAASAAREQLDVEEKQLRARESALSDEGAQRKENLRQLRSEAGPENTRQQDSLTKSQTPTLGRAKAAPPPPASRSSRAPAPKLPAARAAPLQTTTFENTTSPSPPALATKVASRAMSVPEAPLAPSSEPQAAAIQAPTPMKPTNPFHRFTSSAIPQPQPSVGAGAKNPFFRPPTGASPAPTVVQVPSSPSAAKAKSPEEDWGDIKDLKDDGDDSSDEEENSGPSVQQKRAGLAGLLFGGPSSTPSSRPGSARPDSPATSGAPPPPRAPAAPLPKLGGSPPPRNALLDAIQGGAALRKTVTSDRSKAAGAGSVVEQATSAAGLPPVVDATPDVGLAGPLSDGLAPDEDEQQRARNSQAASSNNRQSVDWYGGLAADSYPSPAPTPFSSYLPSMQEEAEEEEPNAHGNGHIPENSSDLDIEFDMAKAVRMRSLYPYEGQRDQDATFAQNLLIIAHPPRDQTNDWMYGLVVATGSKGWLPKTYVEELTLDKEVEVLYDYNGENDDELKIISGAKLRVVEQIDTDWARAIVDGRVGLVPRSYLSEDE